MQNYILKNIFKNKKVDFKKLDSFGFKKLGDVFCYESVIVDGQFCLKVFVDGAGEISSQVVEIDTNEPYTLFLVESAVGSFVGRVRQEYEQVLTNIASACFETETFKSEQAKQIIKYVKEKYNANLEFLWGKFPNNAIWRRADNNKWFGLLVTIAKNKIGLDGDDEIELIVARANPEQVENLTRKKGYAPAYHMNKKNWISVLLDNLLSLDEIITRLNESYLLATK